MLGWIGLNWIGLDRVGLGGIGLDWVGLDCDGVGDTNTGWQKTEQEQLSNTLIIGTEPCMGITQDHESELSVDRANGSRQAACRRRMGNEAKTETTKNECMTEVTGSLS